jgi:hypothetical protein
MSPLAESTHARDPRPRARWSRRPQLGGDPGPHARPRRVARTAPRRRRQLHRHLPAVGRVTRCGFPHVPGSEGSGTVVGVRPGRPLRRRRAGGMVSAPGSYAEYVLVPAASALAVPDGVDLDTAAALPLQGLTAHYLTRSTLPVSEGTTVLLTAGARRRRPVGDPARQGARCPRDHHRRHARRRPRSRARPAPTTSWSWQTSRWPTSRDAVRALVPGGVDVS